MYLLNYTISVICSIAWFYSLEYLNLFNCSIISKNNLDSKKYFQGIILISCLLANFQNTNTSKFIMETLFIFFIGYCSVQDETNQEFYIIFLFPPLVITFLINYSILFSFKTLLFLPLLITMIIYYCLGRFGSGDIWIIIIIFATFDFQHASLIILLACLIHLFTYYGSATKNNAFVPALYYATLLLLPLN